MNRKCTYSEGKVPQKVNVKPCLKKLMSSHASSILLITHISIDHSVRSSTLQTSTLMQARTNTRTHTPHQFQSLDIKHFAMSNICNTQIFQTCLLLLKTHTPFSVALLNTSCTSCKALGLTSCGLFCEYRQKFSHHCPC